MGSRRHQSQVGRSRGYQQIVDDTGAHLAPASQRPVADQIHQPRYAACRREQLRKGAFVEFDTRAPRRDGESMVDIADYFLASERIETTPDGDPLIERPKLLTVKQ